MTAVDNQKIRLSTDGTSYIIFNSTSSKVEIYVKSTKVVEWG